MSPRGRFGVTPGSAAALLLHRRCPSWRRRSGSSTSSAPGPPGRRCWGLARSSYRRSPDSPSPRWRARTCERGGSSGGQRHLVIARKTSSDSTFDPAPGESDPRVSHCRRRQASPDLTSSRRRERARRRADPQRAAPAEVAPDCRPGRAIRRSRGRQRAARGCCGALTSRRPEPNASTRYGISRIAGGRSA